MNENQKREARIKAVMENGPTIPTLVTWEADGFQIFAGDMVVADLRHEGFEEDEVAANAHLIAAAPKLLRIAALVARFAAEGASTISLSALMDDSDTETLGQAAIAAINKVRP